MKLHFYKYHGTGNDFILLDNREGIIALTRQQVAQLCHRRYGIGADGLMLLEQAPGADFRMIYYNADGGESTMCGNGGRCITAFARKLGIIKNEATFIAIDGPHKARIDNATILLHMQDVSGITVFDQSSILNTGSPHFIQWVADAAKTDVVQAGRAIRNEERFAPNGINVNFVQRLDADNLFVRTYERGVEDETESCGTGVTAAAIAATGSQTGTFSYAIKTPGGMLGVSFVKDTADAARDVVLSGPAVFVFDGYVNA